MKSIVMEKLRIIFAAADTLRCVYPSLSGLASITLGVLYEGRCICMGMFCYAYHARSTNESGGMDGIPNSITDTRAQYFSLILVVSIIRIM